MASEQFWILIIAIGVLGYLLERIERRLVDIYSLLKFGKDEDDD